MKTLKVFLIGIFLVLGITFIIAAGGDSITNIDRDLTLDQDIKDALSEKGLSTVESTHTIDWVKGEAETCLGHPTNDKFNMPCMGIDTFTSVCIEVINESDPDARIDLPCQTFNITNKTVEVIEDELKLLEEETLKEIGDAFDKRSKSSDPQIISEGIITIK